MKKLFSLFAVFAMFAFVACEEPVEEVEKYNKIFYTTSDGAVVAPTTPEALDVVIVSNTYENGEGVITFDGDVTTIGENAFRDIATLTSIVIPESVTYIGKTAFHGCVGFENVVIPNSVTELGEGAFTGCDGLLSVTIGEGVTAIRDYVFSFCEQLTDVYCRPTTPPEAGFGMFLMNADDRLIHVPAESVNEYKFFWETYVDDIVADESGY